MNIGELKELVKEMPDDTMILIAHDLHGLAFSLSVQHGSYAESKLPYATHALFCPEDQPGAKPCIVVKMDTLETTYDISS